MGYDDLPSPTADETAEITIEVPGEVDAATFKAFKAALKKCLADLGAPYPGGQKPRWIRVSLRKKPPKP
jgi:hypothetical protein